MTASQNNIGFPAGRRLSGFPGLLVAIAMTISTHAAAQLAPRESAASIQAPQGLEVKLFAAEPMVQNPTSIVADSRGRVWVTEGLNYRLWNPAQQQHFKRLSRADRIKILEDRDGDGQADHVTVFAENLFPVPMGLAIEEHWKDGEYAGCRVFVGNSPHLLVLEDTDGDDQADRRAPLLTGFRGVDSDHGIHGLQFGLDGWLYFTVGDARYGVNHVEADQPTFDVTDRSGRRVTSARYGTVCRVQPDGTQFQVLAHRLRNDYEVCIDSFGERFVSDNDDDGHRACRICWVLTGGNYGYRLPGAKLHNSEDVPGVVPKIAGTGNGSPCGLLVYEGSLVGSSAESTILEVDAGTRQLNAFPLIPVGAAYRTTYQAWTKSPDDWHRPVDVDVAPDGSLLIGDWYDAGVGGNRVTDQTTGRIYRLASVGKPYTVPPWDRGAIADCIRGLKSPNRTTQIAARNLLIQFGPAARPPLERMARQAARDYWKARAYWVLSALGHSSEGVATALLTNRHAWARRLGIQMLTEDPGRDSVVSWPDNRAPAPKGAAYLSLPALRRCVDDASPAVRRQLLIGLQGIPTEAAADLLLPLVSQWDGRDRYYLEAMRLALVNREPEFYLRLFDHLAQPRRASASSAQGTRGPLAIPPYFPAQSNDAYLHPGTTPLPATPTTKLAGVAWVLGRPEAVAALDARYGRSDLLPDERRAIELALQTIHTARASDVLVRALRGTTDSHEQQRLLKLLGDAAQTCWPHLAENDTFHAAVRAALKGEDTRAAAIAVAGQVPLREFSAQLLQWASDPKIDSSLRAATLQSLAAMDPTGAQTVARDILQRAADHHATGALAMAAVRVIGSSGTAGESELARLLQSRSSPAAVRHAALQQLVNTPSGANRLLHIIKANKLDDDSARDALAMLSNHFLPRVKADARAELERRGGARKRLVDFDEVLSRIGDHERGRQVFYAGGATPCATCHRVQGIGNWVGPDLSTIGTKYGKRELLFHITVPSGAINHGYSGSLLELEDGRVLSGIVTSESDRQIAVKTSQGQRVVLSPDEIVQRKVLEESLMPDNLCDSLSDQDLADLLEFLARLRTPVVEIRQLHAIDGIRIDPATLPANPRLDTGLQDLAGATRRWTRLTGDREGRFDLSARNRQGGNSAQTVLAFPCASTAGQSVEIVVQSDNTSQIKLLGGPTTAGVVKPLRVHAVPPIKSTPAAIRGTLDMTADTSHAVWLVVPHDANSTWTTITVVPTVPQALSLEP